MSRRDSSSNAQKTIDISTLSPKQLASIREQLEMELQNYMQSSIALQRAASDFHASGRAIEQLSEQEKGQQLLLPLTSSVYVNGELESVDKVLIDVGTGYFVEKSTDGGVDYCKRKVQFLRTQLEALTEMIQNKQLALQQVSYTLQAKLAAGGES